MNRLDVEPGPAPRRIGIAASTFNAPITDPMLDAALAAAERAGIEETVVMRVPGAMELPLATQALAESGCEAIVAHVTGLKELLDHTQWRGTPLDPDLCFGAAGPTGRP